MMGRKLWRAIMAGIWSGLFLLLTGTIVSAQANIQGTVIDNVHTRTGPGTEYANITLIPAQTKIIIEGRNRVGNWVLIHAADNSLRGWVATRYTVWDENILLDSIPVTTETLAAPAASSSSDDARPVETAPVAPVVVSTEGGIAAQTLDTLKVRTGPDWESATVGSIASRSTIVIEGRNTFGNWVLMHAADNSLRGWVATRYTLWDENILIESIPVSTETLAVPAASSSPDDASPVETAPAAPVVASASGGIAAQTLDTLKVRTSPDWESATLGNVAARSAIVIEGRNAFGNWVLMRSADTGLRGWVATRYTVWDENILLESIPVTAEEVGIPALEVVINDGDTSPAPSTESDMINTLAGIPVLPSMSGNVLAIYQRGQTMGNNPQNFTKIGDSNSESQAYLGLLGIGAYDLGKYRNLQTTIDYYKGGSENSFTAQTQTAKSGMVTTSIIDTLFSDPRYCGPGQTPLECEFARSQPSIALIYLGAMDNKLIAHDDYYNALGQIVENCINRGVIPVLMTMPTKPHYQQTQQRPLEFDMIIVTIARKYDVPLINMWRAVRDLPEHGLQDDLLHFTYSGADYLDFDGGQNQWGYTAWNLAVLQTLDSIRKVVG